MSRPVLHLIITLFVALSLTACQAVLHEKGSILDPKSVAQIKVEETTQSQVKELLGKPTLVNTFRRERWLYIQDRQFKNYQRTFSRVANRVEITFHPNGVVKTIQQNFDDTLLDPEKLPEAKQGRSWLGWLMGGDYYRPATNDQPQQNPTDKTPTLQTESPKSKKSWWRFWSSEKE